MNVRTNEFRTTLENTTRLGKGGKEGYGISISYELDMGEPAKINKFYIMAKNKTWNISSDITIREVEEMLAFMKKKAGELGLANKMTATKCRKCVSYLVETPDEKIICENGCIQDEVVSV